MRGFLYTVCVLLLALSFTYLLIAQNAIASAGMPGADNKPAVLGIAHAEALGIVVEYSNGSTVVSATLDGGPIAPQGYTRLLENYGTLTNTDVDIGGMGLVCGSSEFGFTGRQRNGWKAVLGPDTIFDVSASIYAHNITKSGWELEPSGEKYAEITVRDGGGVVVLSEKGYLGPKSTGHLKISDGPGSTFEVALDNGAVLVRGRGSVVQAISPRCAPTPEYAQ